MDSMFEVGDKAYYPVHGVAEVVSLEALDIGGSNTNVYILKVVESGLTIKIRVPGSRDSPSRSGACDKQRSTSWAAAVMSDRSWESPSIQPSVRLATADSVHAMRNI